MRKQYSLRAVALASVCLLPLAAAAQDFDLGGASAAAAGPAKEYNNEIDVGARYQSSTSPLFGRYTGNDSKGFGSLGGFHLQGSVATPSGSPLSFEANGSNLNFQPNHEGPNNALAPESSLDVKAGQQGTWAARAYYDAITYTGQTFYSPYLSTGAAAPGVPTGVAVQGSAANINRLRNSMVQETAGTRRDIGGVDGKYILGEWTFTSGFRHEHKEGTLLGTTYTAVGGVTFPKPVDYDTDRYSVLGQYATRRLQTQIGYEYSKFADNNFSINLPYLGAGTTTASQYSLPPGNDAHYVTGRLGYNITPTTRLNTNLRYGVEMARDDLGNGTATPTVAAQNSGVGLMARTYDGSVQLVSRPIAPLDLKVSYGISGRDTANSPTTFLGTVNASTADAAANTQSYTVLGQSWTKQKALLEVGYRILPSTKLTLGYAYDTVARDAGDAVTGETADQVGYWVGHSNENTLSAKLTNNSIPNVNTSLSYEHAVRTGKFEFVGAEAESGAFYQAPRTADRIKGRADYSPNDQWSVGANGKFETNSYHYAEGMTGTKRDANATIGPDVSYSPTKAVSVHLFYNYEQIYYVNMGNGCPAGGGTTAATSTTGRCTSSANFAPNGFGYSAATTDSVHTAGLAGDWKVTDRLKIGADYTFSYGDVGYNMYDGISIANSTLSYANNNISLSNVTSSMHSVKLHGEYQLADNISLLAGYGFDLYKDNDWSYGWNPVVLTNATTINTLTSGESQNSYRVHSIYTAIRFKF